MADITIRHTHADGTLIEGSSKGDGVLELVWPCGFRWFPASREIGVRGSRDKPAPQNRIDAAVAALTGAGHTVTVDIDDTWRPAADREQDRTERAETRAIRLQERAGAAGRRSVAYRDTARRTLDGIPLGQPMLVDHNSYKADRNRRERAHANDRRSMEEAAYAEDLARRAQATTAHEAGKHGPRAVAQRIETLQVEARDLARRLADHDPAAEHDPATVAWAQRLTTKAAQVAEEITYLEGKLAAIEADGRVLWQASDFQRGDWVRVGGNGWYQVTRVNAKSVSVASDGWPRTVAWVSIHGRRRGDEQLDTPSGVPWPVEQAKTVARWGGVIRESRFPNNPDAWQVSVARRITVGLPLTAPDAEVVAHEPDDGDVPARRSWAVAAVAVYDRLRAGETAAVVAGTTEPWRGVEPAWALPIDRLPADVRVDRLQPGDLIAGVWDRGMGGRTLWPHFAGPVESVSAVEHRREAGDFVTVTLVGGTERTMQTHVWLAVYRTQVAT
jgi:hypothetical protein